MSVNYTDLIALNYRREIIPYLELDGLKDRFGDIIEFTGQYMGNIYDIKIPYYKENPQFFKSKKDKKLNIAYKTFEIPERIWNNQWDYSENLWKKHYPNEKFDVNCFVLITEEFLLTSSVWKDCDITSNQCIIDKLLEEGYYLYFCCG